MMKWVVSKTCNRFSSIPIDQVHEQENAKMKGKGGIIGLTENPTELFAFFTEKVTSMVIPESKMIFITSGMCLHRILHQCTLTLN